MMMNGITIVLGLYPLPEWNLNILFYLIFYAGPVFVEYFRLGWIYEAKDYNLIIFYSSRLNFKNALSLSHTVKDVLTQEKTKRFAQSKMLSTYTFLFFFSHPLEGGFFF